MEAHEKDFYTTMLGREPSETLVAKHDKALLMADRAGMGEQLMPAVCLLLAVDEADEEVMTAEPEGIDWSTVAKDTQVKVIWGGKARTGRFLEVAGKSETGKLRIAIHRDPQKKLFREVPQESVRLA